MKRKIILLIALFLISAGATAFVITTYDIATTNTTTKGAAIDDVAEPDEIDVVAEQLATMTLDEKVAQLLVVQPSNGIVITESEASRLATAPYGGYILMESNFGSLAATRSFVQNLQASAKYPLIISTDQEGGIVQRIKKISDRTPTDIPTMYRVGKTGDTSLAKEVGRVMAEELRVIGVNVDFAPDADVFLNPNNRVIGTRSFSESPDVVAKMSLALAQGLEENGVIATYKHFPGHGDTATDSHLSLPVINRTRANLDQADLVPFKNAIDNGAKIIMSGHIALPQITGDNTPATLSKKVLTDILRNELGYDGLIITDGMNMGALTNNYAAGEMYYRAIEAGVDLLLLPPNPELAMSSIKEHISEERIDESVYRILKFKHGYLADYKYLGEEYFGSAEHRAIIQRVP